MLLNKVSQMLDPTGFMNAVSFPNWFDSRCSVVLGEFDANVYEDALFGEFSVALPDSLLNSVVKRKAEFLAGRYCAQQGLQRLGSDLLDVCIGESRNPVWPIGFTGSISHNSGSAIAVVAESSSMLGVGIDIESIVSHKTLGRIHDYVLVGSEQQLFLEYGLPQDYLFTLGFSVKESFFKAAYSTVGYYFGFDAVSLVKIDVHTGTITLRLNQTLHKYLPKGKYVEALYVNIQDRQVVTFVAL